MSGQATPEPGAEPEARPFTRTLLRRVAGGALALTALGSFAIAAEALIRGHLKTPEERIPTALYTRPVPWGGHGEGRRTAPIAIGTLDGSAAEERIPVRLTDLPDHLTQAVLAIEDRRYYQHHGLDFLRILGALVADVRAGAITQGGSTITQQVAKNVFLSAGRTPLRKLREVAFALVLEGRYDKATILEAYLNEIYLGQDGRRAIHGVGAAARYYFGKEARKLNLAESALLAGMISAPNRNAPTRNTELARGRRNLVLQLMADQRRISARAAESASRARIPTRAWPARAVEGRWLRDELARTGGEPRPLPARGVAVYTTLDAVLQRAAEQAVQSSLAKMRSPDLQASLVAIDPRTGEVLALVGGRDYGASQFNRATEARRQPGSAFKPVVALAALDRWEGRDPAFTLASVVQDEPLRVGTPSGPWEPTDYDGEFRGPVTLRQAMEQSLNVPFARIGLAVGPDRIVAAARRLGITSPLRAVPSLALGSSEVTLMELVRAYGVFAAGGQLAMLRTIAGKARYGEEVVETAAVQAGRAVDPAVAYLVTSTLEGVVTRGTGRALNQDGRFGGEGIAGKTGTSSEWRDAWFIAYSPALVVGVWVGFDDGRSLGMTGAGAALPIAARFLEQAANDADWGSFEVPDGITEGYASLADGGWSSDCEGGTREIFLEGTEPRGNCAGPWIQGLDQLREWGGELKRRAARVLEELFTPDIAGRQARP